MISKKQKPQAKAVLIVLLTTTFLFASVSKLPICAQTSAEYEYFVPLQLPNQVFPSSDWGRLLEFTGLIDGTNVEVDKEYDGIVDVTFYLDRNETLHLGQNNNGPVGPTDFQQGTYIKSDKPIILRYTHRNNDYGCYDDYMSSYVLLPISNWGKDFFVPMTGLGVNVVACEDMTTVNVDIDHDGIPDITTNINAGEVTQLGPITDCSHITADKKVFIVAFHYDDVNKDDFWTYEVLPVYMQGKEYRIPEAGTSQSEVAVVGIANSSEVKADTDNDGVYDITQILNQGEILTISNFVSGAYIISDKTICVLYKNDRYLEDPWLAVYRHYVWAYSVLPADYPRISLFYDYLLGTVPFAPNHVSLVSLSDGNTISVDLNDDGIVEFSNSLNSGDSWEFDCTEPTYIYGTHPFILASKNDTGALEQEILDGHLHYPTDKDFFDTPCPITDIKANDSDGPISITRADTLSIDIEMDAWTHMGDDADWWLLASTPLGWYYYDKSAGWLPGREVSLQIPLRDLPLREVLNMSGLPAGSYTFYFGVDLVKNGKINLGQAYYDSVDVTINP